MDNRTRNSNRNLLDKITPPCNILFSVLYAILFLSQPSAQNDSSAKRRKGIQNVEKAENPWVNLAARERQREAPSCTRGTVRALDSRSASAALHLARDVCSVTFNVFHSL